MGRRENKVENYLQDQVKLYFNGITRKWKSVHNPGVMDQIIFIDPEWFVEVKTSDGRQEPHQAREAKRLIKAGARVAIVYGHCGVDEFIEFLKLHKTARPKQPLVFKCSIK